jgi:hypothetical protein
LLLLQRYLQANYQDAHLPGQATGFLITIPFIVKRLPFMARYLNADRLLALLSESKQLSSLQRSKLKPVFEAASKSPDELSRYLSSKRTAYPEQFAEFVDGSWGNGAYNPSGSGRPFVGSIVDLAKAELRYKKTYTFPTEYGLRMSLNEVEKIYGANGKKIVQLTENSAKEIIIKTGGNIKGDPVLTGLIDNKTGQIFYGRNLKSQSEIEDFWDKLHPILKKRLEIHNKHISEGTLRATVVDVNRAAILASHSEIVALDQALKARGVSATEADFAEFIIHNKQLGGKVDNIGIPKGCPPRCAHCWFLSDGIKVIGND